MCEFACVRLSLVSGSLERIPPAQLSAEIHAINAKSADTLFGKYLSNSSSIAKSLIQLSITRIDMLL